MPKSLSKKRRRDDLRPHILQALTFEAQGHTAQAEQLYLAVLAVDPENACALNRRAVLCLQRGDQVEALRLIEASLKANPASGEAANDYGLILEHLGRYADAVATYDRSLILKPNDANTLYNRGVSLQKLGRHQEATASFDKALARSPNDARAHNLRGVSLAELGRVHEALACFVRAGALDPDYADAHLNEALTRLTLGEFEIGWEKYEWRWRTEQTGPLRSPYRQPHWTRNESIAGKTLYVYPEQGLGDGIMFARYAALAAKQADTVILCVHQSLKVLLAGIEGVSVVSPGDPLPAFDVQCGLLSLPYLLGTRPDAIPADIPYIRAPSDRLDKWRNRVPRDKELSVGLVWAGGRDFRGDPKRSVGLGGFAPLLADSRCRFVSLHRELRDVDAALLRDYPQIVHFGDELQDFADTAAVVAQLDLIVSVDTSVAHLAGAMGKPVWILLPSAPDFRWMLGRSDSPWYPTATLFRQPGPGDWDSVIAQVTEELRTRV